MDVNYWAVIVAAVSSFLLGGLWYSPILPALFLVSAIGLGLCMVAVEGLVTSWLYRRPAEWTILPGLTRAASVLLMIYLALRLGDLAWRGQLALGMDWASALFSVTMTAILQALPPP